nr:hypothetical protein [Tanacetum cinerariifolium]GEY57141.1 hypothetical protein [Tanacetum cinerariifolium]
AATIRNPVLRVLHKMITYGLCQRTTGYDKIQKNDLLLLCMFDARHQNGYANVAWLVARWMKRNGAGTQKESMICCRQFITKFSRKARVLSDEVLRILSALIYCRALDTTTLRELINSESRLIPEALQPSVPIVAIPRPQRASIHDLYERIGLRKKYRLNLKNDMLPRDKALSWYKLSATCHTKDRGPSRGLYLCWITFRPDLSFDKTVSLERLFILARVSLAETSKPDLSFGCSGGETPHHVPPTLCKQGDWFSFAKRHAPSLVFIDDIRSCMKHWKSGFFFIDRRAIPNAMVCRHPDATINDPRPSVGSLNMADVRRLSAHVIKIRDMPEGMLVLSGLSRVWKSRVCDLVLWGADGNSTGGGRVMGIHDFLCLPEWTGAEVQEEPHLDVRSTLQRLPFYCTPPAVVDAIILEPTLEDLARTRSALAQSSGSTTRPSLFVGDDDESDDDDDVCVEISLVTSLYSAVVIPSSRNQGGSSSAPTAEGSNPQ